MATQTEKASLQAAWRVNRSNMRMGEIFGIRMLQGTSRSPWEPPLDIYELPNAFVVLVELPGLSRESMDVTYDCGEGILAISGWRDDLSPPGRVCTHQMEIRHGQFERRVKVLVPIDVDAIQATYAKGFIKVVLPKARG
jgi:HSP20 family protein